MYSTENLDKLGTQLSKEQSFRYKQFAIIVWYTLLEAYFITVFLKSKAMAVNLILYGTAIVKPKNNIRSKSHPSIANSKTFRSNSQHTNECELSSAKLVPRISIEDSSIPESDESSSGLSLQQCFNEQSTFLSSPVSADNGCDSCSQKQQSSLTRQTSCSAAGQNSSTIHQSGDCFVEHCQQSTQAESCSETPVNGDHQIREQDVASSISPCALVALLNNHESVLLLDCRTFMVFNTNHIAGAVNVSCSDRITKKRLADGKISVADAVSGQEAKELYRRLEADAEIIVYDENSTELDTLQATHPLKLVADCLRKQGKQPRFLIGGLQAFQQGYSCMCSQPDTTAGVPLLYSPTSPEINCDIDTAVASEILPYLFIGNQRDAANKERLTELGITHVMNVTALLPMPFESEGISYKRLPASDSGSQNLKQYFTEAIEFIDSARELNGKVLVHCQAGVSRSPTIVLAYLMARSQKTLNEAFNLVKDQRPIVAPNLNFMGQLLEFEQGAIQRSGLCPPSQPVHLLRL